MLPAHTDVRDLYGMSMIRFRFLKSFHMGFHGGCASSLLTKNENLIFNVSFGMKTVSGLKSPSEKKELV